MLEIDITKNYPKHILTFPGFNLELEENDLEALTQAPQSNTKDIMTSKIKDPNWAQ